MRYATLFFAVVMMAGCRQSSQVQAKVDPPVTEKPPCAPDVSGEMKVMRPTVTVVTPKNSSWDETHKVSCPDSMRTVLPSIREMQGHDGDHDFEDMEYCVPDGKH